MALVDFLKYHIGVIAYRHDLLVADLLQRPLGLLHGVFHGFVRNVIHLQLHAV